MTNGAECAANVADTGFIEGRHGTRRLARVSRGIAILHTLKASVLVSAAEYGLCPAPKADRPIDPTMPAVREPPTGRQAAEPNSRMKSRAALNLNGARFDGRADIQDAASALAPKDREGHKSHLCIASV